MPGEEYTQRELLQMSQEEFRTARENGFRRPGLYGTTPVPSVELRAPVASQPDPRDYAPTVWGASEYDFTCPSGQRCRMRNLPETELLKAGILDQVTRLPGLAQAEIDKAQGNPPAQAELTSDQLTQLEIVLELTNKLLPIAVLQPRIYPIPEGDEERVDGRIYPDSVDITDRVAIMNRALGGLVKLDPFRN